MTAPGITMQDKTATDAYLRCDVTSLFSLKDRVVVITGGARGIGLTLAFAVAEAGGLVAVVDASPAPHDHFEILKQRATKVIYYQSVFHTFSCLGHTSGRLRGKTTRLINIVLLSPDRMSPTTNA